MIRPTWKRWGSGAALLILLALAGGVRGSVPETTPPPGIREKAPRVLAITHARVVARPGAVLEDATVVVRDGIIEAVGARAQVPKDAAVRDAKGLTVYAGFIDAGTTRGFDPSLRRSEAGPPAPADLAADPPVATKPDNRKGLTPEFAANSALRDENEPADG